MLQRFLFATVPHSLAVLHLSLSSRLYSPNLSYSFQFKVFSRRSDFRYISATFSLLLAGWEVSQLLLYLNFIFHGKASESDIFSPLSPPLLRWSSLFSSFPQDAVVIFFSISFERPLALSPSSKEGNGPLFFSELASISLLFMVDPAPFLLFFFFLVFFPLSTRLFFRLCAFPGIPLFSPTFLCCFVHASACA